MSNIVLEVVVRTATFSVCRSDETSVRATSSDVVGKLGFVISGALSVGAESNAGLFINRHSSECNTADLDITDKVTSERQISSFVNANTDSPPSDEDVVDYLDIVRAYDGKTPVLTAVDGRVRDLGEHSSITDCALETNTTFTNVLL